MSQVGWDVFVHHKLRCILISCLHGTGDEMLFLCFSWHGCVWSTLVDMHVVYSLSWEAFVQHK